MEFLCQVHSRGVKRASQRKRMMVSTRIRKEEAHSMLRANCHYSRSIPFPFMQINITWLCRGDEAERNMVRRKSDPIANS